MDTNKFVKLVRETFDQCKSTITMLEDRNEFAEHLDFALKIGAVDHSQYDYLKSALNDSYEMHYWQMKKEIK